VTVRAKLRRAGAMTLLVYGVHTLAAGGLAAPLIAELARALATNLYQDALDAGDAAVVVELAARRLPELIFSGGAAALAYALLAPLLRMAWLDAMRRGSASLRACLGFALRRYPAALAVGALAWLSWGAAGAGLFASLTWALGAAGLSAAGEQALRAACVAAAAAAWLLVSTLHDMAVAAIACDAKLRRAVLGAAQALGTRAIALHAASALGAAACYAIAEAIGRSASAAGPTAVLALQQLLVFAATLLRGTWLAIALELIRPRCGSPAPRAAGSTAPTR
jgi:hypothetical protein